MGILDMPGNIERILRTLERAVEEDAEDRAKLILPEALEVERILEDGAASIERQLRAAEEREREGQTIDKQWKSSATYALTRKREQLSDLSTMINDAAVAFEWDLRPQREEVRRRHKAVIWRHFVNVASERLSREIFRDILREAHRLADEEIRHGGRRYRRYENDTGDTVQRPTRETAPQQQS